MNRKMVTVVSGLPRSGTSLMMQMLEAGGVEILTDGIRQSDENNPKGYYELEAVKKLDKDQACLENAEGKAVKIISALLKYLPSRYNYKIIFMHRDMGEVLASQKKMLIRNGKPSNRIADDTLSRCFQQHINQVSVWLREQSNIDVLNITYSLLIKNPAKHIERISHFLGISLNLNAMAGVIDVSLYRQRHLSHISR
jgi:hypothetical protein